MDGNTGSARGGVDQRVEQRPIRDGVGAVAHGFGFAERRSHGAGIQMIAANHDRRLELAAAHQAVHRQAKLGPLAVAQPADARRQALEADAPAGQRQPAGQRLIVREEFGGQAVGAVNVLRIAGERHPTKGTAAFAEQRSNVLGHEARNIVGAFHARLPGLGADVVAVIEGHGAPLLQREHGFDVNSHGR